MSDLISRSKAVQRLIQETVDSKNNLIHINTIKRLLQDVDIAYNIGKVVDELGCDRCENCSFLEVCAGSKCCTECHKKIIEIVRHGGVSDDVCEWR